jgi:hypothetical protein
VIVTSSNLPVIVSTLSIHEYYHICKTKESLESTPFHLEITIGPLVLMDEGGKISLAMMLKLTILD